nr:right-handed parallel beta-helix repeat-containing protein [FCB group bacterium]
KIYDFYDEPQYGFVNYGGWLDGSGGTPTAVTSTGAITLVNASGVEVLNYDVGEDVYVRVVDADANAAGGLVETITVMLSSATETGGETLTLTETGMNTGIFVGSMGFDASGGVSADGVLQVSRGDKVSALYADPADDFGNPVDVRDVAFYGVTLMSGTLYGPNTWDVASSPYLVTGDVTVDASASLTIEPGVEVRFVPLSDDQSSGEDANRSELKVYGTLTAIGTDINNIVFTSNSETPSSGDWYGIYFQNGNANGNVQNMDISHGTYGVRGNELYGSPADTFRVLGNHIHNSGTALYFDNSYRFMEIKNNQIEDCNGYGIYVGWSNRQSRGVIDNNTLDRVSSYGMYIGGHDYYEITNNSIDTGNNFGIYTDNSNSFLYAYNEIFNRNDGGISINGVNNARVEECTIQNNGNWGIQISSSNVVVEHSTITNNSNGVYINTDFENPVVDTLRYNTIANNSEYGIHNYNYGRPVVQYNDLHDNGYFDYRNSSSTWAELDARYNWWGQATTDTMDLGGNPKNIQKIYDFYDEPQYGFVNYGGYLPEPFDAPLGPVSMSISQYEVMHGDTILVALNTTIPTDTSFISAEVEIGGYGGLLEFVEIVTDNSLAGYSGWNVLSNEVESLIITASAGATPITGDGVLFWVKFVVPDTLPSMFIPIEIGEAIYNTGDISVDVEAGGIQVIWEPVAEFMSSDSTGMYPLTVDFTDLSIQGTYPIVSWAWDFGDGTSDTLQHPSHSYSEPGIYSVSLTITDGFGLSSSMEKLDFISMNGIYGDVDLNTIVQAYDAGLILQYLVNMIDLTEAQQQIGNVSLDEGLSALDASLILQYMVHQIDSLPYDTTQGQLMAAGDLGIEEDYFTPGTSMIIPVHLQDGLNIYSFEGEINMDIDNFTLDSIGWTANVDSYSVEAMIDSNNHIIFAGASSHGYDFSGAFMQLYGTIDAGYEDDSLVISIDKLMLNENLVFTDYQIGVLLNTVSLNLSGQIPTEFSVKPNYPNPFNPVTHIDYGIPEFGDVQIRIYDVTGRTVKDLKFEGQSAGWYSYTWNGTNFAGAPVSSGLYLCQIQSGHEIEVVKMLFLK